MNAPTPLEQPCETKCSRRRLTIGLPKPENSSERRFPLTPEGVAQLVERGFSVRMQENAAASIHYPDEKYVSAGVEVAPRRECLGCDIVISTSTMSAADARCMRRGSMLLTLLKQACADEMVLKALLERHVITIALDLIEDEHGNTPFADILAEIDGRASVAMASSLLADSVNGKGILLGGVAGIVPCEVVIIGSGIAARAAARSAVGLGAIVRMFDSDVYSLRHASQELGPWLITSTLHPHTLSNALHAADVVIVTPSAKPFVLHSDDAAAMKKGVLSFDLTADGESAAFPSMVSVDLATLGEIGHTIPKGCRVCYVHAGSAVARTSSMALTNTLLTLMESLVSIEGPSNALKLHPGMQKATLTFFGKPIHPEVASRLHTRSVDISIFLTLS